MAGLMALALGVPSLVAYLLVAVLVFLEAALFVGFLLPGETAVLLGGVLAAAGHLSLPVLLCVVVAAAVLGDSVGFEVGRRLGPRILDLRILRRHRARLERAQGYLRLRAGRAVVMARFTAFLRAVMPALAGASGMPYKRFLPFNLAGGLLWGVGVALLGFFTGSSFQLVAHALGHVSAALLTIVAVTLLLIWHRRRRTPVPGDALVDQEARDVTVVGG